MSLTKSKMQSCRQVCQHGWRDGRGLRPGALWVALCLPLLLAGCDASNSKPKQEAKQQVEVATAASAEIPLVEEFVGQTAAVTYVDVRAKVQGYLTERPFVEGSDVKKGDVLFVIDQRPFQAEVNQNKAELEQNQGRLDFAKEQLARYEKLKDEGTASVQKYESTRAEAIEAAGELAASQAALQNAQLDLDYATITSPIDGRVSNTLVDVGNLVSAEDTLLTTVVQLDPIYVYFSPSEETYQKMVPFQAKGPLKVSMVLSSGEAFPQEGTVDFVDNKVDPNTGTIKMRAVIPNPDKTLRPGQFVTAKVTLADKHQVVLIPAEAVAQDEGGHYVYVVGKDDTVNRQDVTIGPEYQASYVIEKGVKPGDRVVVTGLQKVHAGAAVEIVEPGSNGPGNTGADKQDAQAADG
ncbi:efflux RND transporter periplasmic adaptor subunit [Methyloceanibacter caenitepidi]|uniref:efflux RND transporter periplasmic adaptor subunit n=1 Tax=Methyloceanibacter caenitepidi TaxID=1384459 RepID=UPI0006941D9C|nr:efflux RND transporter periplasmic adaptor subunit [Methyloceanibacter caenitepidi]